MENNVLLKDEKHAGKYVAFVSVIDHTVVAEGDDPQTVINAARRKGYEHPMVVYIPDKDVAY